MAIEDEVIDVRSGTASDWAATSLVLGQGELGVVTDTGEIRVGDGSGAFSALRRLAPLKAKGNTTLVAGTKNVTGLTGVATGDVVVATVRTLGTVTAAKALVAVAGTDQITVTSADNTDTSVVNYAVYPA
jgi:hypothetical protein